MLIHDGEQRFLGEPEEAALGYYRLNFGGYHGGGGHGAQSVSVPDVNVRLVDVWLEDEDGRRVDNVEQEKRFRLSLVVEARQPMVGPVFNFHCLNMDGDWVFALSIELPGAEGQPAHVAAGEQVRVVADIENPLVPGRYAIGCWISRRREEGEMAIHVLRLLDFFVYGTKAGRGNVLLHTEVEARVDPPGVL
jgi:hypothetical protein